MEFDCLLQVQLLSLISTNMHLTADEYRRYARHLAIPNFGIEGQLKLKAAKVLVVGSGGLGSPLLLYLTAAGIGHIGIVDFDTVDESNLQRQVLFNTADIGKAKAETARQKLLALNPNIKVTVYNEALTSQNALDIIKAYDVVADGTDNFPTRYLVNDACVLLDKINVYASIFRFEGQVAVFNFPSKHGQRSPNYRDLFPEPPPPGLVPNCAEGGVLGVLPGIIGSIQASEVIKIITGVGDPLAGKLFIFDLASFTPRVLTIPKTTSVKITELIDYEQFCGLKQIDDIMQEITVSELKKMMDEGVDFQLIDVREPHEYEFANIQGELIPLNTITEHLDKISRDKPVVMQCRSGGRSGQAIKLIQAKDASFTNLHNLKGGIIAWSDEIDNTIPKY